MFNDSNNGIEIRLNDNGNGLPISPACIMILDDIAGSKVKLSTTKDANLVDCEITLPESYIPIKTQLIRNKPKTYELRCGSIAQTLERLVFDIRVGANGSL